jgi:hypothetical protein
MYIDKNIYKKAENINIYEFTRIYTKPFPIFYIGINHHMYIDKNIYKKAKNPEMYVDMEFFLIWIYGIIDESYGNLPIEILESQGMVMKNLDEYSFSTYVRSIMYVLFLMLFIVLVLGVISLIIIRVLKPALPTHII